jgi:glycosyltransferase involved in cell wall biosynthesis
MLEAMACGTPVFAFPGGSVPEIVFAGRSGTISASAEEMADAVRNSTFKPEIVRDWVEERFSVELMVQRYIGLYERVLINDMDSDARFGFVKEVAA